MMPRGFNYVPDSYVIGTDCYWRNGRPVEPDYWPAFKQLQENKDHLYRFMDKPLAFSIDFIEEAFNPVYHMTRGTVIRDSIFQFHSFIESLNPTPDWLRMYFDEDLYSFVLYLDGIHSEVVSKYQRKIKD